MTTQDLKDMKPGAALYDTEETGLQARCYPSGRISFLVYYKTKAGRQRRPKIGNFPSLSLDEARKRARGILAQVEMGGDPKGQWESLKRELTVDELFMRTLRDHWSEKRYAESGWKKEVEGIFRRDIQEAFGTAKLSEITPPLIKMWHQSLKHKPNAANRALDVLSRMFTFAEEVGLRSVGTNPCSRVSAFTEKKRKRVATEDEIRRLALVLDSQASKHPRAVAYLYTLIFCGARPFSLEKIKYSDLEAIAHENKTWGVVSFDGKGTADSGEKEQLILPPTIMKMLWPPSGDGLLFGKFPRDFYNRCRDEIGAKDLWARDFRRTFASMGMSEGVGMDVIGELLNHKSTQTTKRYALLNQAKKIEAVKTVETSLNAITAPISISS